MRLCLLLAGLAASVAPLADARSVYHLDGSGGKAPWQVTGFDVGCSPGGCAYRFVISGHAYPNTPGFNTTCQGTDVAGDYQPCADKTVSANLIPRSYPLWTLQVRHRWSVDNFGGFSEEYGSANITSGMTNFTVPITMQDGAS